MEAVPNINLQIIAGLGYNLFKGYSTEALFQSITQKKTGCMKHIRHTEAYSENECKL